jgi:hypothetical protein
VTVLAALGRYLAHADPATRIANSVALLVGSNGPFYPAYVWFLAPEAGPISLATMAASPFFLAIPWLSRRSATAARIALPMVGIANTVWTAALLGPATGVAVFLFPCLVLALLSWREKPAMLAVLGSGLLAQQALLRWPWPALSGLDPIVQAQLVSLNAVSVGALVAVLVLSLSGLLGASTEGAVIRGRDTGG